MQQEQVERKIASPEFEEFVKNRFPMTCSAEEFAARESHNIACFSMDQYKYQDKKLDVWIQRLGKILFTPGLCEKYQKEFLSSEEIIKINENRNNDDGF